MWMWAVCFPILSLFNLMCGLHLQKMAKWKLFGHYFAGKTTSHYTFSSVCEIVCVMFSWVCAKCFQTHNSEWIKMLILLTLYSGLLLCLIHYAVAHGINCFHWVTIWWRCDIKGMVLLLLLDLRCRCRFSHLSYLGIHWVCPHLWNWTREEKPKWRQPTDNWIPAHEQKKVSIFWKFLQLRL